MTGSEWTALVEAFQRPPYSSYRAWTFDFEYPGVFVYNHESLPTKVYFTPEFNDPNEIALQIQDTNGNTLESESIPFFTNKPEDLFAIVRQWLDFTELNAEGLRQSIKDWRPTKIYKGWKPRHQMPF
jgi:hypothetical protein